jgi:hypothetical protein
MCDHGGMARTCFPLPDVLDAATCQQLIGQATARGFARTGGDYPPSYRDNDRLVLDDPDLAAWLFERVRGLLPATLDLAGETWALEGLNERFRFCRYQGGQGFRIHRDGAHAPTPERRSLLTFQIYLDDTAGFSGGHTRFYAARRGPMTHAVVPREGHAIVFDHQYWHDGEPVPEGTKHVLRTDVIYRRSQPIDGHTGYVYAVLPLADGRVASASRDRTIRLWRDGVCTQVLAGHEASITCLAEPAPGVLLSGSRDRTVRRWDLARGSSEVVSRWESAVRAVTPTAVGTGWTWCLVERGDDLLSGHEDGTIRARSGRVLAPGRGPVHALACWPDGRLAAGFADGWIAVYDPAFQLLDAFPAHDGEVYALATVGPYLASGGEDDMARVWSGARCLAGLEHQDFVRAVARLDDETVVTGSYDGGVRLWRFKQRPAR